MPYPSADENPPRHKYAAVFDARPCFDGLRSSFFWPSRRGAEARCKYVLETLDAVHSQLEPHVLAAGYDLAAGLLAAEEQTRTIQPGFRAAALPAYIEAIQRPEYWFSCEELLWVAECAGANLIMARNRGDVLEVAGSVWQDPEPTRPVAIVSLHVGGPGRVRSHFERVCPADLFTNEAQERRRALEADEEERRRAQEAEA